MFKFTNRVLHRLWIIVLVSAVPGIVCADGHDIDEEINTNFEIEKVLNDTAGKPFVIPPKSISDLALLLSSQPPTDPLKISRDRILADEEPRTALAEQKTSEFYFKRSQAAARLGRSAQEIKDLNLAQQTSSRFERNIREDLAEVLVENGSFGEAVKSLRTVRNDYKNHGLGFAFRSLSFDAVLLARAGLLNEARQVSVETNSMYHRITALRVYSVLADFWECYHFQMQGALSRASGKIIRSIQSFRKAIAHCKNLYEDGHPSSMGGLIAEPAGSFRLERKYRRVVDLYVEVLIRAGHLIEAESVIRTAIRGSLASTGRNSILTTNHLLSLSNVLLAQGRLKDAETIAGKIIGFHSAAGFSDTNTSKLKAHLVRARALAGQNSWQEAGVEFSFIHEAIGDQPSILTSSLKTSPAFGLALSYSSNHAAAERLLSELATFNRESLGEKSITTALSRGALGVALNRSGKGGEALPLLESVLPVIAEHSRKGAIESTKDAEFNQWKQIIYEAYLNQLAKRFAKTKDPAISAKAFQITQLAAGGSVQKAFAASSTRAAAGNKELSGLVRGYQDLVQHSKNLNGLLLSRINQSGEEGGEAVLEELRQQVSDINAVQASLAGDIEDRFPEYSDLMNPRPISLTAVRASLKSGEALIVTHVGDEKSYVWAIPKSGEVAFSASELGRKKLRKDIGSLRRSLNPLVQTLDDIPAFNVGLAGKIYSEILEPVAVGWKSARNLLVIPDGPLGQLPFSVLVTKPTELEGRSDPYFVTYKKVPFLVKSHSVTVVPSVSSLIALRKLPSNKRERKNFVGIADPFFSKEQAAEADKVRERVRVADNNVTVRGVPIRLRAAPKLAGVSTADLALLPRLPDTADEVIGIATVTNADLGRDVFLGRDASEDKVKELDLTKYKIIVFATHGLMAGDLDGLTEPGLALTSPSVSGEEGDGILSLGEILALKLDADWVVLSACNTASADGETSEAMSGLARAFFYAGARALLVSNWPVETISAKKLTIDIFRRQATQPDLSRAQAVRISMVQLLNGPGFTDQNGKTLFSYAHPIFWAPFALVGDGAASLN